MTHRFLKWIRIVVVELGYVVDRLANFCGPNLAVLYEVACALDEMHGTNEQEPERPQRNEPHRH
jgi:hypothetical protein